MYPRCVKVGLRIPSDSAKSPGTFSSDKTGRGDISEVFPLTAKY